MLTPIKLLSLFIVLNITCLHSMEVDEQKEDIFKESRLLTKLPDDVNKTIIRYATKDKLFNSAQLLIRLSQTCKACKHYSEPEKMKAILILNYNQEELNTEIVYLVKHHKQTCTLYAQLLFEMGAQTQNLLGDSIRLEKPDLAKLLIEYGDNINHQFDICENTPLHLAIKTNQTEIVKLLLNKGANMYSEDIFGHSPVTKAMQNDNPLYLKILIEHGLDTSIEYTWAPGYNMTIAEWAKVFRQEEIYELITGEKGPKKFEEMSANELLYVAVDSIWHVYSFMTNPLQYLLSMIG